MKSLFYSLLAIVFVALIGSFLGIWKLPYQTNPYTYRDLTRKLEDRFEHSSLQQERAEKRRQNEEIFGVNEPSR